MRQDRYVKDLNEKLHEGSFRRTMMKRYLDTETSIEEEQAMAAYYAFNAPDEVWDEIVDLSSDRELQADFLGR